MMLMRAAFSHNHIGTHRTVENYAVTFLFISRIFVMSNEYHPRIRGWIESRQLIFRMRRQKRIVHITVKNQP